MNKPKENSNEFVPDEDFETYFPWEDVTACLKNKLESNRFTGHSNCIKCGLESGKLIWIQFSSPDWTWEHLCGREGPLSICPDCKIQVEFILEVMN